MQSLDKLIMFTMAVNDMPVAKEFYETQLGFKVTQDYGEGDRHWVSLELPGGGPIITLSTYLGNMKPGSMNLYISASDIQAAHEQLKAVEPSEVKDDLYGPGSQVKFFEISDPDGNQIKIVEAKK